MKDKCFLKTKPFKQCCCQCQYLVKDYSHPTTDGKPMVHLIGYVCVAFMLDHGVHSGWTRHSIGCEMYTKRKRLRLWCSSCETIRMRRHRCSLLNMWATRCYLGDGLMGKTREEQIESAIKSGLREEVLLERYGVRGLPCLVCGAPQRYLWPFDEKLAKYIIVSAFKIGYCLRKICRSCQNTDIGKKYLEVTNKIWELDKKLIMPEEVVKIAMEEVGFEYKLLSPEEIEDRESKLFTRARVNSWHIWSYKEIGQC